MRRGRMHRGRIVLITGTDTGVGKTYVGCGLVRALRAAGGTVAVRKPAETGCAPGRAVGDAGDVRAGVGEVRAGAGDGGTTTLYPADAAALRDAAGGEEPLEVVCAHRFAEPLAPAVAARRAGVHIDVERLVHAYRDRARGVDALIVEGAGGLLVPLSGGYSYADLARDLGAAVLVVVAARLGAVNHTLLTLEATRARGLELLGLVVNHLAPTPDLAGETLLETLRASTDVPIVAEVGFAADPTAALRTVAEDLGAPR